MKKQYVLLTIFISITALFGCKSSDSPTPAAPSPHFSLSNESFRALQDVGCDARDGSVKCSETKDLHGIQGQSYKMRNLEHQKVQADKQMAALEVTIAELKNAENQKWSTSTSVELTTMLATATAAKAALIAKSASLTAQISQETLFQTVLGYFCSGDYSKTVAEDISFTGYMPFINSSEPIPDGVDKDIFSNNTETITSYITNIGDSDASIWMREDENIVRLRLGTPFSHTQNMQEVDVFSVRMDGEFTIESQANPYQISKASCLKKRLTPEAPKKITQRIIERGPRLKCEVYSSKPKTGTDTLEYFGGSSLSLNFNNDDQENRMFTTLFENMQLTPANIYSKYIDAGYKYIFDMSNDNGNVTFDLIDVTNGESLAVVTTVNSSKDISLNYLNQGYGARIDCSTPEEN